MTDEKQTWIVKRYIVETFESCGDTREEALENLAREGIPPVSCELKNETAVKEIE